MSFDSVVGVVLVGAVVLNCLTVWVLVCEVERLRRRVGLNTHRVYRLEGGRCLASCPMCRDLRDRGIEVQA